MATQRQIGKVTTATGGAAALTTLACWIMEANGIIVPGEVQGAITTLIVVIAGYLVPAEDKGRHEA